ncbi:sodium:solute symporter [Lachnospiraceae bacterium 54-53]
MNRSKKRRYGVLIFMGLSAAAILYSLDRILNQEAFQWIMNQSEYQTMMAETAKLFAAFCLSGLLLPKNGWKLTAAAVILSVFLWVHQAFTPVAATGLYLAYILFFGRFLRASLWRLPRSDGPAADFLTGTAFLILVYCLMSAMDMGAIEHLYIFLFVSAGVLLLFGRSCLAKGGEDRNVPPCSCKEIFFLAFILTMLCLQAGRMNLAVDYDSLWYGVRSRYILDNGHGIYENMGTIGIVYTYSKGFEVLTLPLSRLPSYSFVTSINLWLAGGVLYMGYKIGLFFMKRDQALFLAALLSSVPGIMNMAVAAKSDIMTLLVQEIMVYYLLCYVKAGRKSWRYLGYGVSAYFLSLTLKPTALIFSTAVFGMAFLYLIGKLFFPQSGAEGQNSGVLAVMGGSLLALAGIWARTMVITGLPVTSVFSSLLTRLGFHMKYPFAVNSIPNGIMGKSLEEKAWQFAKRLYGFFFCPVGPDMDHVILAWGGYMLFFLLLLWIVTRFCGKNVDRGEKQELSVFLGVVYVPFLAVNLLSLAMLTQVDGNYFMLLYVLTSVYVLKGAAEAREKALWRGALGAGVWMLLFSVFFTAMTNWNWSLGFSPASFRHKGYFDHQEAARLDMAEKGNEKIWKILEEAPETRLIAIGDHPSVLVFPCSVQSYDDITGVWGNVTLVKKMDYFVEFMDYAKTDYVYVQAGYTGKENRSYTLVKDLIEWGKLVPVFYENGNLLAKVEVNGSYSENSVRALTEFEQCYIKKEANEKQ